MRLAGDNGLSAAADHTHGAAWRLDGLGRTGDAPGADRHNCEHNAGRNGHEGGQGRGSTSRERRVYQGRAGEDSAASGKGQRTLA
jgi:hypothetical protein